MNLADELLKLKQLRDEGALSEEEFVKAKQAVLDNLQADSTHEHVKSAGTIHDHLLRKTPAPEPPARPGALAYAAVTPKVAALEPDELHQFTFTLSPHVYKEAQLLPPRLSGWYPDFTRFICHLTDRRILIEPHEFTSAENVVIKGADIIGSLNLSGKILGAVMKEEMDAGQKELHEMRGHSLAVPYSEIAKVEKQRVPRYQFISLVKVIFTRADVQPLVVAVNAGVPKLIAISRHSAEFIKVMTKLLGGAHVEPRQQEGLASKPARLDVDS